MSRRLLAPALWFLMALLAPARALAQSDEIHAFDAAKTAYDAADYEEAIVRFGPLVDGGERALTSEVLLQEARKYYAASLVLVGRNADAVEVFERMLATNPNERLSAALFPTRVLEHFNEVRDRMSEELHRQRAAMAEAEAEARRRHEEQIRRDILSKAVLYERSVDHRPLLQGLLPFGVAQFQNDQNTKGVVFLLSEALVLAINVSAYWLSAGLEQADAEVPANHTMRDVFFAVDIASFGALAVLFGLGAWDGIANLETERVVRRRLTPEEVRAAIDVGTQPSE